MCLTIPLKMRELSPRPVECLSDAISAFEHLKLGFALPIIQKSLSALTIVSPKIAVCSCILRPNSAPSFGAL